MLKATSKKIATLFLFILPTTLLMGQESADFMRSTGKIYVVVGVIVAIFIGIVIYLVSLDRKISKLENQIIDND